MTIYSKTYPGCIYICEECGCLFGIDPQKDIYEEKYVYCPLCHHKIDSGIHSVEWRYAVERREEAQPDVEENSNSNGSADSSSTPTEQDSGSGDDTGAEGL